MPSLYIESIKHCVTWIVLDLVIKNQLLCKAYCVSVLCSVRAAYACFRMDNQCLWSLAYIGWFWLSMLVKQSPCGWHSGLDDAVDLLSSPVKRAGAVSLLEMDAGWGLCREY